METTAVEMKPPTELMMTIAMLDCQMQTLKTKIHCKKEENSKLETLIEEHKSEISILEKNMQSSTEREEKVKKNLDGLRNSKVMMDGLIISLKRQCQIKTEKRCEVQKVREGIIKQYTDIFNSYSEIYKKLPWVKDKEVLRASLELSKIDLLKLKQKYWEYKRNVLLFNNIQKQRVQVKLVEIAEQIVARNKKQTEINYFEKSIRELHDKLKSLEIQKCQLMENMDQRAQDAIKEAKQRALRSQLGISTSMSFLNPMPSSSPKSSANRSISSRSESIFARLGFSAPLLLKRSLVYQDRMSVETKKLRSDSDDKTINNKEGTKIPEEVQVRCDTPPSQTVEPMDLTSELQQTLEKTASEEVAPEIPNLDVQANLEETSAQVEEPDKIPSDKEDHRPFVPEPADDENRTESKSIKKTNNKRKSKSKIVKKSNNKEKKVRFSPEISPEKLEKPASPVARSPPKTMFTSVVQEGINLAETSGDITGYPMEAYKEISYSQSSQITDVSYPSTIEDNMRRDLSGVQSPEFFTAQRTVGGYCFSPPAKSSPPRRDKSSELQDGKGSYDFNVGSRGGVASLFAMDDKKQGSSAAFGDFFGSKSPKKDEKSTKTFFQLFG